MRDFQFLRNPFTVNRASRLRLCRKLRYITRESQQDLDAGLAELEQGLRICMSNQQMLLTIWLLNHKLHGRVERLFSLGSQFSSFRHGSRVTINFSLSWNNSDFSCFFPMCVFFLQTDREIKLFLHFIIKVSREKCEKHRKKIIGTLIHCWWEC